MLGVPPAGPVTVTPSKSGLMFVPASYTFVDVTAPITNQNFLAVGTTVPVMTTQVQTNSLILSWYGISGIMYMPFCSTNLVEWYPYDIDYAGTNGPMQLVVPMSISSNLFFQLRARY